MLFKPQNDKRHIMGQNCKHNVTRADVMPSWSQIPNDETTHVRHTAVLNYKKSGHRQKSPTTKYPKNLYSPNCLDNLPVNVVVMFLRGERLIAGADYIFTFP